MAVSSKQSVHMSDREKEGKIQYTCEFLCLFTSVFSLVMASESRHKDLPTYRMILYNKTLHRNNIVFENSVCFTSK